MRKLYLFILLAMSTLYLQANEPSPSLDLTSGDVLKCLIQAAESQGWSLIKAFHNSEGKLVVIFLKEGKTREYVSNT